jgi:hypothetical protein
VALFGEVPTVDFVDASLTATKLSKSCSLASPITLLLRHDATPSLLHNALGTLLPHIALGRAFPLASLCDAPSLWDAPPPPSFFLSLSFSADLFSLTGT